MNNSWWRYTFWMGLLSALVACSPSVPKVSDEAGYVATVEVAATDSQAAVEAKYGGEAVVWRPEAGFAILKLSQSARTALADRGISVQTTTNSSLSAPELSASGIGAWAGGWNAWGGGWNAWAGGWNSWGGGSTLPTLPGDNRRPYMTTHLMAAHAMVRNFGAGVKVAVIDTGLDTSHPMFSGRLAPSTEWKDFVDGDANPSEVSGSAYGHGTAVAGTVLQFAPRATILPIRVLGADGTGDVANIVSAIDWAIQKGVHIINLSLGTDVDVPALKTQIDFATSRGIYVVAASGNEGSTTAVNYPAAYAKSGTNAKYMISVGSSNGGAEMSGFSNRGAGLEFVIIGEKIFTAYPGSQVAHTTGTSFAAPQVAGVLAVLWAETAASNRGNLESLLWNSGWSINGGSSRYAFLMNALRQRPDFVPLRKALFVVGNTTLNAADAAVWNKLDQMGYSVTVRSGSGVLGSDANGHHLVLISSTVQSTDVNTKFRNTTVPVVLWEPALYDDMGMVTGEANTGQLTNQNQISILPNAHPLAGGLNGSSAALYQVYNNLGTLSYGIPLSSAIRIANSASNTNYATVFAYTGGAQLWGLVAPARRVALYLSNDTAMAVQDNWKSEFLFDAAVTWATSNN